MELNEFLLDKDMQCEMMGCLIDTIEDFLEEHGVYIPNDEKEEDNAGIIFGSLYDELKTALEKTLKHFQLVNGKNIYRVENATVYDQKVTAYMIQNMFTGEMMEIRREELPVFCKLRDFMNARYAAGTNRLEPLEEGFPYKSNLGSKKEREERSRLFFEELCSGKLHLVCAEEPSKVGVDPRVFLIQMGARKGRIEILPGTEYFNRLVLDRLKVSGVCLGPRNSIRTYDGARIRYMGWVPTQAVPRTSEICMDMYSFEIRRPSYDRSYTWLSEGQSASDVEYVVHIREDIQSYVYVGKDNRILHVTVMDEKCPV